ncbi:putative Cysteine-rich RLK 30 [Hibiscus syriacus]|uniref:non-specific serine/threonine protein kinase n=1 Tax=Hibiscus syriacus TaxID=106335 RepID=A0A6A2ZL84_HIBSY|nr:putative Cysteine-rich RLK 30 [Hibiscus syriacus]
MDLSCKFLSSSLTIAFLLTLAVAQQQPPLRHFCLSNSGNFTANSTYETNLNALLSSFSRGTPSNNGFYNFSSGQPGSDRANALALCRGDLNPNSSDCFNCINAANAELRIRCPFRREAIIWYDHCMFRYTNRSILGVPEFTPNFEMQNANNVPDASAFNQALGSLLENLRNVASSGTSLGKFATGSARVTPFQSVFARVQCTNDLAEYGCRSCLSQAVVYIPRCCDGKQGGRVCLPSCNLRVPSQNKSSSSRTTVIVSISAVAFAVLVISGLIVIVLRSRKGKLKRLEHEATESVDEITTPESLQYDFNTISSATNRFSDANKLGQGGFGAVYKGTLAGGKLVAVKRLSTGSAQGDLEFKNEVRLMANLQHRNLVRLQGFCLEGTERLLIYEFVPNGSLDKILFDPVKKPYLNWERRYRIIEGIARGLLYLHQDSRLRIIHRDLKASNILLDAEMTPKIADFGMARLCAVIKHRVLLAESSEHTDTWRLNTNFHNGSGMEHLLSFAWRNWEAGTALDVVDPCLRDGSSTDIIRCYTWGCFVFRKCSSETNYGFTTSNAYQLLYHSPTTLGTCIRYVRRDGQRKFRTTASSQPGNDIGSVSENELSVTEMYPR